MGSSPVIHTYTKPYLAVADQIALLQSRGMEITEPAAAAACLGRIGYYRLSGTGIHPGKAIASLIR
jgi:abortive infection bacteriophage resistance protein